MIRDFYNAAAGRRLGEYSSRRIAWATFEDVAFRLIAAGEHPHFTTISQFRLDHGESLGELFVEVLLMCQRAGLVKMVHVALDGRKIKAAASKARGAAQLHRPRELLHGKGRGVHPSLQRTDHRG
jgi:hypothetical protein